MFPLDCRTAGTLPVGRKFISTDAAISAIRNQTHPRKHPSGYPVFSKNIRKEEFLHQIGIKNVSENFNLDLKSRAQAPSGSFKRRICPILNSLFNAKIYGHITLYEYPSSVRNNSYMFLSFVNHQGAHFTVKSLHIIGGFNVY